MYGTITPYGRSFQNVPLVYIQLLGSSVFARHYSQNNYCSLFLRLLRCFSSPGFLPLRDYTSSMCRVAPFGHLRINARLQLPVAFRSLPRPSSSLRAKASTIRPYLLPILTYFIQSVNPIHLHHQHSHASHSNKFYQPTPAYSINTLFVSRVSTLFLPTCQRTSLTTITPPSTYKCKLQSNLRQF